jgi:hypothetical protein
MGNTISENKAAFTAVTAAAVGGLTYWYLTTDSGPTNSTKMSRKVSLKLYRPLHLPKRQPETYKNRSNNSEVKSMSQILPFKTLKDCLLCWPTTSETKLWKSLTSSKLKEEKDSPKNADSAILEITSDSQAKVW